MICKMLYIPTYLLFSFRKLGECASNIHHIIINMSEQNVPTQHTHNSCGFAVLPATSRQNYCAYLYIL